MKVLVTGASGFLGGWMVKKLKAEGLDIAILHRRNSDLSELKDIKYESHLGDVTNLESIIRASQSCDSIFHLAGLVAYTKEKREAMNHVNIDGTKNVIQACLKNKVRRLLHMSSVVAVGASFDKTPLDESSSFNVSHLNLGYFETKKSAEDAVLSAVKNDGLNAVAVNPSTFYGPGDAKKESRKTQLKVAQGKFPFYTSGGVSVAHVEDIVDGTFAGWQKGRVGERYILSGENITIQQLFNEIASAAGVKPPAIHLPTPLVRSLGRLGDWLESKGQKGPINSETAWTSTLYHWFKCDKAQNELGFKIRPAREAIEDSVGWMKSRGYLS